MPATVQLHSETAEGDALKLDFEGVLAFRESSRSGERGRGKADVDRDPYTFGHRNRFLFCCSGQSQWDPGQERREFGEGLYQREQMEWQGRIHIRGTQFHSIEVESWRMARCKWAFVERCQWKQLFDKRQLWKEDCESDARRPWFSPCSRVTRLRFSAYCSHLAFLNDHGAGKVVQQDPKPEACSRQCKLVSLDVSCGSIWSAGNPNALNESS